MPDNVKPLGKSMRAWPDDNDLGLDAAEPDRKYSIRALRGVLKGVYKAQPEKSKEDRKTATGAAMVALTERWDKVSEEDRKKTLEWLGGLEAYAAGRSFRIEEAPTFKRKLHKSPAYAEDLHFELDMIKKDVETKRAGRARVRDTEHHSLSKRYREIGRRAARHYGTTKERWEAGGW
ncbi:hypothetical protein JCM11641_006543 [Rhodosporidiobolus odoratus]